MSKLAVIGAGAWGTALACHAARVGHEVVLWALEPEVAAEVNAAHRNTPYLPDVELPASIRATNDLAEACAGAGLVLVVVPSQHVREIAARMGPALAADAIVVVAAKGVEEGSLALMSDVVAAAIPKLAAARLCVLSGPTFAREVARGLPADVVVAAKDLAAARAVQAALHAPMFRVYASSDPIGVQIGGALKNVIAVAAGACDGLGLGTNARAGLITRGLMELTRLGVALGANPLTFLGLAGVGDLVLTCTGDLSRNRTLGRKIAEGMDAAAFLASRRSVAEGFATAAAARALAHKLGVGMPITEQVYSVLHEGRPLERAFRLLVGRDSKDELLGLEGDYPG